MKRLLLISLFGLGLAGCAELGEYNQKLANWAGEQIKIRDQYKQEFDEETTSGRDIDSLYTRIKREFGFKSKEEAMGGCSMQNINCRLQELAISSSKVIHERTPGVYYRMAREFTNQADEKQPFYLDVTLSKNGKNTDIEWNVRGNEAFANQVKQRMLKTIK